MPPAPSPSPPTHMAEESALEDLEASEIPKRRSTHRRSIFGRRSSAQPQVSRYQDHFTLQAPTSYVRFHDSKSAARVIYNQNSQLVIEEKYDYRTNKKRVTIKQVAEESSSSLKVLRLTYTSVGAFFLGFLFVFTMQVMLFVALDFAIHAGLTEMEEDANPYFASAILFSFPIFVHGFALIMMLAGLFVLDLWRGHPLFRKFVCPKVSDVFVEWMFVICLLILPFCVMGGALCTTVYWWQVTSLYWFFSVLICYLLFVVSVVVYEARVFLAATVGMEWFKDFNSFLSMCKACILLRNRHGLGGYTYTDYMSFGTPDIVSDESQSRKHVIAGTLFENQRGIYDKFTQWSVLQGWLYKTLDKPKRLYSVDDITDRRPYMTSFSWSLEKYFCQPRNSRYIGIIKGPGAVTQRQLRSTVVCALFGLIVIYFVLGSVLVYFGLSWGIIAFVVVIAGLVSLPFLLGPIRRYKELVKLKLIKKEHMIRASTLNHTKQSALPGKLASAVTRLSEEVAVDATSVRGSSIVLGASVQGGIQSEWTGNGEVKDNNRTVKFAGDVKDEESESDVQWTGFSSNRSSASMGVYSVTERYRITEPTERFSLGLELCSAFIFVFLPTSALYYIESWQLATIYVALCAVVDVRHHTNARVLVQELGRPDGVGVDDTTWSNQSRMSQVTATISRGKSYQGWRAFYLFFSLILIAFGVQALFVDVKSRQEGDFTMIPDFHYESQNSLHYTSCDMTRNLDDNMAVSMADYIFLSALVYRTLEESSKGLTEWYGEGVLKDRDDIVKRFRSKEDDSVPVYYRLYTHERDGLTHAAVAVRGTQNAWDLFTDCQLWGAAALLQMIRALLPFGYIWDPILDEMIVLLSKVQSGSIERLSFYKSTTKFVEYLQESGNYTSITILGHSLGGGVAIITGAQTHIQAVGVSGPNAMISRQRFKVTVEELEQYTFNVIPDRDPIGAIDDPTKNVQRIECRAAQNTVIDCHAAVRTLCEAIYVCGTGSRPAICECTTLFGYPKPDPLRNAARTFEEACGVPAAPGLPPPKPANTYPPMVVPAPSSGGSDDNLPMLNLDPDSLP